MNNTFALKRFGFVFKKLLFEKRLQLCSYFILVALFTWFLYHMGGSVTESWQNGQRNAFPIGLTLGGLTWVSFGFNYFSNKESGYTYLLMPASHVEKWLSVLVLFLTFITAFCLFFRILDTFYVNYFVSHLDPTLYPKGHPKLKAATHILKFWGSRSWSLEFTYFVFFNMTGAMSIGSLYFNKMAFVKTVFVSIIVFVLINTLNAQIAKALISENVSTSPMLFWRTNTSSMNDAVTLPKAIDGIYTVIFNYILPLVLWLIALIRLREKEL